MMEMDNTCEVVFITYEYLLFALFVIRLDIMPINFEPC